MAGATFLFLVQHPSSPNRAMQVCDAMCFCDPRCESHDFRLRWDQDKRFVQARKRHININLLVVNWGMGWGGGRNGHFWGAPVLGQNPGKYGISPRKDAKSGRPKNSRSYHHPSHPPVDALLNINFLVRLLLGHPGNVPGTKWVCPRDKPRFSPYFTQWKPSLSLGQARFVPGTFWGRRAEERVYVLKVYVHFSFPNMCSAMCIAGKHLCDAMRFHCDLRSCCGKLLRGQKVGHGLVVYGMAKFQALKFAFQGLKFPVKSLVLLVRSRLPHLAIPYTAKPCPKPSASLAIATCRPRRKHSCECDDAMW